MLQEMFKVTSSRFHAADPPQNDGSTPEPPCNTRRLCDFSSDSDDETLQLSQANLALCRYKSEAELDEDSWPLEWWKSHAGAYQTIATLACKYLTTPPQLFHVRDSFQRQEIL